MGEGLRRREFLVAAAPVMLAPMVAARAASAPRMRLVRLDGDARAAARLLVRPETIPDALDALDLALAHPTIPGLEPLVWSFERRPLPALGAAVEVTMAADSSGRATLKLTGVVDRRAFEQTISLRARAGRYALLSPDGTRALELRLVAAPLTNT